MINRARVLITLLISATLFSCFGPFNPENRSMGSLTTNSPANNQTTIIDTLVAWWKCDDSGSEVLKNSANYFGNTGNLPPNMEFVTGFDSTGYALKFGNGSQRITVNDDSTLDFGYDDFTISLWCISPHQIGTNDTGTLISKGFKDTSTTYTLSIVNNQLIVMLGKRKYRVEKENDTLSSISWNHIALVRKTNILTIYINNQSYTPESFSTHSLTNGSTLFIGMDNRQDHLYRGYLDEIKIERKAWNAINVAQEFGRKK